MCTEVVLLSLFSCTSSAMCQVIFFFFINVGLIKSSINSI